VLLVAAAKAAKDRAPRRLGANTPALPDTAQLKQTLSVSYDPHNSREILALSLLQINRL
jgi:hypothetical protein